MAKDKKNADTTTALMEWVSDPDNLALEIATKEILDSRFGDPANTFKVAALAIARQELSAYPAIVDLENDLYQELFSKARRVTASNAELVQMGKLLHERKASLIELANGDGLEKPRIEVRRIESDGEEGADATNFTPRQRERMRRALQALTRPDGKTK